MHSDHILQNQLFLLLSLLPRFARFLEVQTLPILIYVELLRAPLHLEIPDRHQVAQPIRFLLLYALLARRQPTIRFSGIIADGRHTR